jgi:hypothetical protein
MLGTDSQEDKPGDPQTATREPRQAEMMFVVCVLQMNAHIECPPGHIDLSRYAENDKQQGSTRLSTAEIHALESFYYGLNR